ncbi:MAG TPA: HD domain-containing phosphohydrolase [Dongiaceae bacterium]|nr:HD domain-containing phosphohydrolase [Dongiaceae bacterium]
MSPDPQARDLAMAARGERDGRDTNGIGALGEAVLALRSTSDLATACRLVGEGAVQTLGADAWRLLRLDVRSGALRLVEEGGVETPYLAEPGGPVEHVCAREFPVFDEGTGPGAGEREALLWAQPPAALAAMPVSAGSTLYGCMLVAFSAPRTFGPQERVMLRTFADALALALERDELRCSLDGERQRRIELEHQLGHEEATSSHLMASVAHEIRTPLTTIKAYTETLMQSLDDRAAPRERFLSIINEECDRLSRLVTDVLDLSRLEAGLRPLKVTEGRLVELVSDVVSELGGMARVRRVTIQVSVPDTLRIEGDRDLIRRMLSNLVANAIRFSPPGEEVRVDATVDGDGWQATVEDRGPSIPPADLPRLFERFARARRPGDNSAEGTGLALALARGAAELHGGRLWAESDGTRGVRFMVAMPLRQVASARARRIAAAVVMRGDLRDLFQETVDMVAAVMDAGIVSLMLVDPDRGDLVIAMARGLEGHPIVGRRTAVRSGVAGTVAAWARPVLVDDIETDRRFQRFNHPQYSTKSLLSVPLLVEGEVLGVVNVNNKNTGEAFDAHDLSVLVALVERVGSAVERAYAYPDSGRAVGEAVATLRSVTRLHAEGRLGTRHHVRHARLVASEMGLPDHDIDRIGWCAAVHDVGMAPLQRHLWSIEGPLDDRERRVMQRHPEAGAQMLRSLEYHGAVRDAVLAHHERWDGGGYPRGLAGDDIPLGARILAVVDAYESMRAGRPWRAACSHDEAIAELEREAGAQFDPAVVEALVKVIDRERSPR